MSKELPPGPDKKTELSKRYPVGFVRTPKVESNPSPGPESNWRGFETHQILNSDNEHFYNRMSDAGKGIARSMYETGYHIPGISRVMAGIEIGYNNSWMRRHERKASKWKDKMDAKDTTINVLEKQRANLEKQMASLQERGMPGSASLQVAMQKIERQKAKLLNKKGKYQTRFEKREDKIKSRISKRDIVADRMVGKYETKLRPIEKQIENLKIDQEHFNLEESALKVRHKAESARLDQMAKDRAELVEALGGGWRARHNDAVKAYDRMLADGQRTLDQEKDEFSRRKAKLDDYVAKLDQAANPYRKKRDRFVRAKEDRSVDFHAGSSKKESPAESGPKPPESKESEKLIGLHVADWNEFLKKSGDKIKPKLADIILDEFLSEARMRADVKLEKKDFADLLENFYAYYHRKNSGEFSRENFKKIAAD
ncbi:MAG TPA: hypothetical protein VFK07_00190, partial [Candidatus Paceibacterota bacterium]|nr:hypothetical protein [Candidatus Paceibacterota bacterium]